MKLKFKKIFLVFAATASLIIPVSLTSCSDKNQTSSAITSQDNSPNQPTGGNSGSSGSGDNTGGNSSSNPSNPNNTGDNIGNNSNPSNIPSSSKQSSDELPKLDTPLDNSLGLPITPEDDPNGYTNIRVMEESGWNKNIYNPIILKVINKYCNSNFTSDNIVTMFSGYDPEFFTSSQWSDSRNNYYVTEDNNPNNPSSSPTSISTFFNNLDANQRSQLTTIENTTWHKIFSTCYVVINSDTPLFNNVVDIKNNNAVVKDCIWLMKNTNYQYLIKLNVASKPWNLYNLYFTTENLKINEDSNLSNEEIYKPKEIFINSNIKNAKDDYYYQPTLVPIYLTYNSDGSLAWIQSFSIVSPIINNIPTDNGPTEDWIKETYGEIYQGKTDWNYFDTIIKNTINPFQGWLDEYYWYQYPDVTEDCFNNSVTESNLLNLFKKIDPSVKKLHVQINAKQQISYNKNSPYTFFSSFNYLDIRTYNYNYMQILINDPDY